jgi:hypothetical protein
MTGDADRVKAGSAGAAAEPEQRVEPAAATGAAEPAEPDALDPRGSVGTGDEGDGAEADDAERRVVAAAQITLAVNGDVTNQYDRQWKQPHVAGAWQRRLVILIDSAPSDEDRQRLALAYPELVMVLGRWDAGDRRWVRETAARYGAAIPLPEAPVDGPAAGPAASVPAGGAPSASRPASGTGDGAGEGGGGEGDSAAEGGEARRGRRRLARLLAR